MERKMKELADLYQARQIGRRELMRRAGRLGLGADGKPVASEVNQRTLGLRIEDLRGREVVAIAGGPEKREAILAALASGIVTGLIIDEATARLVLAAADRLATRPPRGNARPRPSPATV